MAFKYDYNEERNSVEWQRKVDEIRRRDNYTCQICGTKNKQVHVHHTWYNQNLHYWEYPNHQYITMCGRCHELETILNQKLKAFKQSIDIDVWNALSKMMQTGIPLLKLVKTLHLMDENTYFPSQTEQIQQPRQSHNAKYNIDKRKKAFIEIVKRFEDKYEKDYLENFIDYWTEVSQGVLRFDADEKGNSIQLGDITELYISIKLENWLPEYELIKKDRESKLLLREFGIKSKSIEDNYRKQNIVLQCNDLRVGGYCYDIPDRLLGKLLFEKGLFVKEINKYDAFLHKDYYLKLCYPINVIMEREHKLLSVFQVLYEAKQAFKSNKEYNRSILSSLSSHITYKSFCVEHGIKYPKNLNNDKSVQDLVNSQEYPIKIEYKYGCIYVDIPSQPKRHDLYKKLNEKLGLKLISTNLSLANGGFITVPASILFMMDGMQYDFRDDSFENGTMKSIKLPVEYNDVSFYVEKIEKILSQKEYKMAVKQYY